MPDPFISAQDLTDLLGRDVTADDGALIALDAACDIVRDIAERDINHGTATVTLDGAGTDALPIPNRYLPVNQVSAVTVAGTAEADFMVTEQGVLLRGTSGAFPRPAWPEGRQNVAVTVDYGWAPSDIPRSVRMVALALACRIIVQGVTTEETVGDVRVKYAGAATDLTGTERIVLSKYRHTR